MIEDIEITNFRCFDRLKVSGYKRINLISGKNNVGKTALLEAIFLNSTPTAATVLSLSKLRGESINFRKILPEKSWDNLFFQQEIDLVCSIKISSQDNTTKEVELLVKDRKGFLGKVAERLSVEEIDTYDKWLEKEQLKNGEEPYILLVVINARENHSVSIITPSRTREINLDEFSRKDTNYIDIQNALFIPSSQISTSVNLTIEFDKARLNDRDDEVLKAFQIIDNSIVAVESFSIPEPTIYLLPSRRKTIE
jgi:AAA15 family ATPase/GTPase